MRLTKKTVLIGIASLVVLGLCLWGGSLYLTRQNALKRFDEKFIHLSLIHIYMPFRTRSMMVKAIFGSRPACMR